MEGSVRMGKQTRSVRLDPALDKALVARAEADDVAMQVILQRALEEYLGLKRRPSQADVPVDGPAPLYDKTAGQTPVNSEDLTETVVRTVRQGSALRCQCAIPQGDMYCLTCGKVR